MGLKGYRLWVMGELDSNVQSPHLGQRQHGYGALGARQVERHKLTHN
jgi:hypothetical protein